MTPDLGEKEVLLVRPLRSKGSIIAMLVLAVLLVFGATVAVAGPPLPVGRPEVIPIPDLGPGT